MAGAQAMRAMANAIDPMLTNEGWRLSQRLLAAKRGAGASGFPALASWPFDPRNGPASGAFPLTHARMMLTAQLVKAGTRLDGVAAVQQTQGVYTAQAGCTIG